jgi:hypothetical protein
MTTKEAKSYKFEYVKTLDLREGDIIKFGCTHEGTTIARVKGLRRYSLIPSEISIYIDALWSTQGDNWFVERSKVDGDCVLFKRRYSKHGPFGRVLKAH